MLTLMKSGLSWTVSALVWLTKRGRWIYVAVAITAIIAAITIANYRKTQRALTAATEELRASEGEVVLLREVRVIDNIVVAEVGTARQKIVKDETIKRKRLERAVANNPAWADQPIPADVLASLRD